MFLEPFGVGVREVTLFREMPLLKYCSSAWPLQQARHRYDHSEHNQQFIRSYTVMFYTHSACNLLPTKGV